MYRLYHQIICPFSRKIRILMTEKNLDFHLIVENFWLNRRDFIALNPRLQVPVLLDEKNFGICGSANIVEYLEEKHDCGRKFLGTDIYEKAEIRRLQEWFDEKFFTEVSRYILNERYFNQFLHKKNTPNLEVIRIAKYNLENHLDYLEFLLTNSQYLALDRFTIADIAAAAQISALDYFGDIRWQNREVVKNWYCIIKSQKGFSDILRDRISNIAPCEHYNKLDF